MRKNIQTRTTTTSSSSSGTLKRTKEKEQQEKQDPCHNGEIPSCRLLVEAMEDIFPELQTTQDQQILPYRQQEKRKQQQSNSSSTTFQKKRPSENEKQQASTEETNISSSSLSSFGQMVRQRYIVMRKRQHQSCTKRIVDRGDSLVNKTLVLNGDNNSNSRHSNKDDDADDEASQPVFSKKKKKRKKKKKPQGKAPEETGANASSGELEEKKSNETEVRDRDIVDNSNLIGKSKIDMSSSATTKKTFQDKEEWSIDDDDDDDDDKMLPIPSLDSLPSDDNMSIDSFNPPEDFIDQIRPQDSPPNRRASARRALQSNKNGEKIRDAVVIKKSSDHTTVKKVIVEDPLKIPFFTHAEGEPTETDKTKQSTKELFYDWIDQFVMSGLVANNDRSVAGLDDSEHGKEWDSFLGFCNQRTIGREKSIGVSVADLLRLAESIECSTCRDECMDVINQKLDQNLLSGSPCFVLNPMVLERKEVSSLVTGQEVDAAFDYVALEEGHHLPHNQPSGIQELDEFDDEESARCNISFQLVTSDDSNKKRTVTTSKVDGNGKTREMSTRVLFLETLTREQIDSFLREWLPTGVVESSMVDMGMARGNEKESSTKTVQTSQSMDESKTPEPLLVSGGQLSFFKKYATENQETFTQSLREASEANRDLWFCFQKEGVPLLTAQLNLEMTGFAIYKNYDDQCDKHAKSLLNILRHSFSLVFHAFDDLQLHLWTMYLNALMETIDSSSVYYKKLEEDFADQNGALPVMFVNSDMRKIYGAVVAKKIDAVTSVGAAMDKAFTAGVLREWFTGLIWQYSNAKGKIDDLDSLGSPTEELDALDGQIFDLVELLTKRAATIHEQRISRIERERKTKMEDIMMKLSSIVHPLRMEYNKVEQYFSQNCRLRFTKHMSTIENVSRIYQEMRLLDVESDRDVANMATGSILLWRHVRIMQSRMIVSRSIPPLPLPLRQWELESPFSIDLGRVHNFSLCWPGCGGGKRRVRCILAGLVYGWLKERCNEWNAEAAVQQLLTDIDLEDTSPQASADGATKSSGSKSKKSKKKKNKPIATPFNGSLPTVTPSEKKVEEEKSLPVNGSNDSSLNRTSVMDQVALKKVNKGVSPHETSTENIGSYPDTDVNDYGTLPPDDTLNGDLTDKSNHTKGNGISVETTNNSTKDTDDDFDIDTYHSHVMLKDDKGFIPAREYLIQRYTDLMKDLENENSMVVNIAS